MDEDRFIVRRHESTRRRAGNAGTRAIDASELGASASAVIGAAGFGDTPAIDDDLSAVPVAPTPAQAFTFAWPAVRERLTTMAPGLLAVAVDHQGVAATVGIWARPDRPVSAIVGRHRATDLYLPDDPTLSLRHLVLLVLPLSGGEVTRVAYRVLDLRSGRGFLDEHLRPVQALESDGPMFVHAGRYTIILFPVPGPTPWPADAREAWRQLPPRTFLRPNPSAPDDAVEGTTSVHVVEGPTFARMPHTSEGRLGLLRVASTRGATAFAVGERSARAGILLGRYDRCDNGGLQVLDDPNVSRVHLLVVEIEGALYAIDTGSTNGVRQDGTRFRERALGAHHMLELGLGLADVEWLANH